jgi:hypothetical protein
LKAFTTEDGSSQRGQLLFSDSLEDDEGDNLGEAANLNPPNFIDEKRFNTRNFQC